MKYVELRVEKVLEALKSAGITPSTLVKNYYEGKKNTHGSFKAFIHSNMTASKLCKICNIIGCRMDDLFEIEGDVDVDVSPSVRGNNNNVNSTVINQDLSSLKSENRALKRLIEEKDQRINDLKNTLTVVIDIAQGKSSTGQNSTNNKK